MNDRSMKADMSVSLSTCRNCPNVHIVLTDGDGNEHASHGLTKKMAKMLIDALEEHYLDE